MIDISLHKVKWKQALAKRLALFCGPIWSGCYDQSAYARALQADAEQREAAWAEAERLQAEDTARHEDAWADSEEMLEKERERQNRWEALLTKQEEQARRFDAVLDKWESMPLGTEK